MLLIEKRCPAALCCPPSYSQAPTISEMMYESWYLGSHSSRSDDSDPRSSTTSDGNGNGSRGASSSGGKNNQNPGLTRRFSLGLGRRRSSTGLYPGVNYGDITIVLLFYLVQQQSENLRQV